MCMIKLVHDAITIIASLFLTNTSTDIQFPLVMADPDKSDIGQVGP